MSNRGSNLREFGEFRLFVEEKQLWFSETPVKLPEKALDVLVELTDESGRIVTREHLTSTIWAGESGADNGLAQAIHTLRKTFRSNGSPELIVTIPRRGYRFVGTINDKLTEISPILLPAFEPDSDPVPIDAVEVVAIGSNADEERALPSSAIAHPLRRKRLGIIVAVGLAVVLASGLGLWRYGAAGEKIGLGSPRSIAVLPLKSESGVDPALRLRVTDSLITRLSEMRQIRVRPLSVVQGFIDSTESAVDLGKQLEVDLVFDGTVQLTDEVLKVELRAISIDTGLEVWRDQFVGDRSRLLLLQDTISESIVQALQPDGPGNPNTEFSRSSTEVAEAYEHYLKGRYFAQLRTPEDIRSSITHFRRATELDPKFAAAFAGLADSHFLLYDYNYDPSHENIRIANENISTALDLDPNNYKAFVLRGHVKTRYEWDWAGAEQAFEAAFLIRPDSADAFHRRGMMYLNLREFEKAQYDLESALRLEPRSIAINMNLGVVKFFSGKHDEASEQLRKTIGLSDKFSAPKWYLARCIWQAGNETGAIRAYQEALRSTGSVQLAEAIEQIRLYAGPNAALDHLRSEWEKAGISKHSLAIISAHQKDKAATLAYLKDVVETRHPWASSIYAEPEFAFLIEEPEFQQLIEKLGVLRK